MQIIDSLQLSPRGKRAVCIGLGAGAAVIGEVVNHALTWYSYDGTDSSMSSTRHGLYVLGNVVILVSAGVLTYKAAEQLKERFVLFARKNEYSQPVSTAELVKRSAVRALVVYAGASVISFGLSSLRATGNCQTIVQKATNPSCWLEGDTGFASTMNITGRLSFYLSALALVVYEIYFMILQ